MNQPDMKLDGLTPQEKRELLARLIREKAQRGRGPAPLAHGQRALWYLQQLAPDSAAYNAMYAWRVKSALDVEALRRSLQTIQDRHEALRTTYEPGPEGPVQRVHESPALPLEEHDAGACDEAELLARVRSLANRPFDLQNGPVWRVVVVRHGHGEHALLLTFHHIGVDFWSGAILLDELRQLYSAERAGTTASLPAIRVRNADYARVQAERLAGADGARLWSYWQRHLGGELPTLRLPTDHPRPVVPTYRAGTHHFSLSAALTKRLTELARREGLTPFTLLLSGLFVLLHRLTQQDDIIVGVPTVGRDIAGFEYVVGYFVNPIAIRGDLRGNPSFRDFLGRMQDSVLGAMEHQAYPFSLLVEKLRPPREAGRSPLFDVMFALQSPYRAIDLAKVSRLGGSNGSPGPHDDTSDHSVRVELGDLVLETMPLEYDNARFDLDFDMWLFEDRFSGRVDYNANLFEPASVARMVRLFSLLLEQFAGNPSLRVGEAELVGAGEREELLREFCAGPRVERPAVCVHELFEEQARRTPAAEALRAGGESLTYAELDRRAESLARGLRARGVGPQERVALLLERTVDWPVALLGVLKAGGAYVPLSADDPRERLAGVLREVRPRVVLASPALVERLPADAAAGAAYVADVAAEGNDEAAARRVGPDDPAYIIYTSGSTGAPKGVVVAHRSIVNHNLSSAELFELRAEDRVLQFASPSFDASVEEIFPTWSRGAALVLRDSPALPSCAELLAMIERHGLTVLNLPTAYWHQWVDDLRVLRARVPERLRLVVVGGEKAARERLAAWYELGGESVRWINTYGPTEATIISTAWEPPPGAQHEATKHELPIGRPLPNVRTYVVDGRRRLLPMGVAGELLIGGAAVALGYFGREELTAERFVPDPFDENPGARCYCTGDRVRFLPDGNLEFLGRVDEQQKIRGYRVEPGEIEAALRAQAAVNEALVMMRQDGAGGPRLAAYVTLRPGAKADAAELLAALRERLPEYMVPAAVVVLPSFPLTVQGKIDRRALPSPAVVERPYVAPRTPLEEKVAHLWVEVLGVERVGVHDSFFELGGHSLLAAQLVTRLRAEYPVELPLISLLTAPTVANLAALIERGMRGESAAAVTKDGAAVVPLREGGPRAPLYLMHAVVGDLDQYRDLMVALGDERAVYGIQSPALAGVEAAPQSMAELAELYADLLQAHRAAGPYLLAGHSMGGLIALAVTEVLERRGQQVAWVGLFDTNLRLDDVPLETEDLVAHAGTAYRSVFGGEPELPAVDSGLSGMLQDVQAKLLTAPKEERAALLLGLLGDPRLAGLGLPLEQIVEKAGLVEYHGDLVLDYRPPTVRAPIHLFRAMEGPAEIRERSDAVLRQCSTTSVQREEVEGQHFTLMHPPYVTGLAARLRAALVQNGH